MISILSFQIRELSQKTKTQFILIAAAQRQRRKLFYFTFILFVFENSFFFQEILSFQNIEKIHFLFGKFFYFDLIKRRFFQFAIFLKKLFYFIRKLFYFEPAVLFSLLFPKDIYIKMNKQTQFLEKFVDWQLQKIRETT